VWIATPSLQWTLTTYSLPVSRRTENAPFGVLRMRQAFEGIKKIPHPEEVAERPSRRTHCARLSSFTRFNLLQRPLDVSQQVGLGFEAGGEAHQRVADPELGARLGF